MIQRVYERASEAIKQIVVATDDAVLVIPREKLGNIKKYINTMKADRTIPKSLF